MSGVLKVETRIYLRGVTQVWIDNEGVRGAARTSSQLGRRNHPDGGEHDYEPWISQISIVEQKSVFSASLQTVLFHQLYLNIRVLPGDATALETCRNTPANIVTQLEVGE